MERLEIITVVLIGVGAILIANPIFLGSQDAPGTVVIEATAQEPTVEDFSRLAAESEAVTYDPNVTRWETLTDPERELIDRTLDAGGAARISRSDYQDTYRNASDLAYLRPGGFLYRNGSLYRPRFSRAQRGLGFTVQEPQDRLIVGDADSFSSNLSATASEAVDGSVPRQDARMFTVYDYLIVDGGLYAPVTEGTTEAGNDTAIGEDAANTTEDNDSDGVADDGNATVRLEPREVTVLYDALSVNIDDVPRIQRGQLAKAIDEGSYDTGNASVGALRQLPMVRSNGSYYTLAFDTAPPGLTDIFDTANILGFLLGLVFIVSGLYYAREVHRIRTAEWEA